MEKFCHGTQKTCYKIVKRFKLTQKERKSEKKSVKYLLLSGTLIVNQCVKCWSCHPHRKALSVHTKTLTVTWSTSSCNGSILTTNKILMGFLIFKMEAFTSKSQLYFYQLIEIGASKNVKRKIVYNSYNFLEIE